MLVSRYLKGCLDVVLFSIIFNFLINSCLGVFSETQYFSGFIQPFWKSVFCKSYPTQSGNNEVKFISISNAIWSITWKVSNMLGFFPIHMSTGFCIVYLCPLDHSLDSSHGWVRRGYEGILCLLWTCQQEITHPSRNASHVKDSPGTTHGCQLIWLVVARHALES
jgi:hypothetical protein